MSVMFLSGWYGVCPQSYCSLYDSLSLSLSLSISLTHVWKVPDAADEADHATQQGARDGELRDEDDERRVVRPGDGIDGQHDRHESEPPAAARRHRVHHQLRCLHHPHLLLLRVVVFCVVACVCARMFHLVGAKSSHLLIPPKT